MVWDSPNADRWSLPSNTWRELNVSKGLVDEGDELRLLPVLVAEDVQYRRGRAH